MTGPARAGGSTGVWYVVLIGAVLLIATALYAAHLHRLVETWRQATHQLTIGQDLLRADRDEILAKARDREATLATLEVAREEDQVRLEGLEKQRRRLQGEVLRLTHSLAESEQRANGVSEGPGETAAFGRLEQERDRLARELDEREADMSDLQAVLAEKEQAVADLTVSLKKAEAEVETLGAEMASLEDANTALEEETVVVREQLAERRENERLRQIIRGHLASLEQVKPYITQLGPEDWSVIESWLALQLGRPMAVPDLAAHGFSYEGARLIGSADGPPMAMLLYADAADRPVSLTIARDRRGEQPLSARQEGEVNLLGWREERHAFMLAGESEADVLQAVGVDLMNQPPRLEDDAPVPESRYVLPSFRPTGAR